MPKNRKIKKSDPSWEEMFVFYLAISKKGLKIVKLIEYEAKIAGQRDGFKPLLKDILKLDQVKLENDYESKFRVALQSDFVKSRRDLARNLEIALKITEKATNLKRYESEYRCHLKNIQNAKNIDDFKKKMWSFIKFSKKFLNETERLMKNVSKYNSILESTPILEDEDENSVQEKLQAKKTKEEPIIWDIFSAAIDSGEGRLIWRIIKRLYE